MKKILVVAPFLCLAFASFAQIKTKVVLIKGQQMEIHNSVNATSSQEMMGQKMETNVDLKILNTVDVKDSTDSSYHLINIVKNLKAKLNAMGQDMNFDSDKKEDMSGNTASGIKDVINKPKDLTIDKYGNSKTISKIDTSKTDQAPDMIKLMIQQLLGDPTDASFGMADMFIPLPQMVVIGYSWTDSSKTDEMTKIVTYTVKNISPTEITLVITGTLKTDIKMQLMGEDVSNRSTGKSEGEEVIDRMSSTLKKRNVTINISGTMEAMGQEIPVTSKVISTTTVKNL
jgi:hypothetical protein